MPATGATAGAEMLGRGLSRLVATDVPTAVALFPAEPFPIPPRPAAERLMNVQRWSVMPRGGHFAAMEEPALFSDDVCSFFNALPEMR